MVFHAALRVKLFLTYQASVFSSLKFALNRKKKQKHFTHWKKRSPLQQIQRIRDLVFHDPIRGE